ncbi:hypothetical protein [Microbacterium panaciterrae]|uniref:Uncharacterized protein n=1 Tax=Microbacterium panaciterrae TaxID=985759 RepID=A0ABP8NZ30_9MICO
MNEVQGPTPTGNSRPYKSLAEALRAHRVDPANHDFIDALVEAVGITTYIDRGRYIEAVRRGEGAALHIGKTYTNGFTAEEQVIIAGRALPLLPSEGREPYFYVTHPSELPDMPIVASRAQGTARSAGTRSAATRAAAKPKAEPRTLRATVREDRDYGVCDVCFMVRNAAGRCGCD